VSVCSLVVRDEKASLFHSHSQSRTHSLTLSLLVLSTTCGCCSSIRFHKFFAGSSFIVRFRVPDGHSTWMLEKLEDIGVGLAFGIVNVYKLSVAAWCCFPSCVVPAGMLLTAVVVSCLHVHRLETSKPITIAGFDYIKLSSIKERSSVESILHNVRAGATLTFDVIALLIAGWYCRVCVCMCVSLRCCLYIYIYCDVVYLSLELLNSLLHHCVASIIAAAGLASNSSVVVVASMLVSPLMGPIMGFTFGTIMHEWKYVCVCVCVYVAWMGALSTSRRDVFMCVLVHMLIHW
jgi:Domain of unknown function (DUF389)